MEVVIAPDSFKESVSAELVAEAIAAGVRDAIPDAEIVCIPMADGGEGTVDAVLAATGGERRTNTVRGPLGAEVSATWGWLQETKTAVIEMAAASGIHLVPAAQRDATRASTYGTGQLVLQALDAGGAANHHGLRRQRNQRWQYPECSGSTQHMSQSMNPQGVQNGQAQPLDCAEPDPSLPDGHHRSTSHRR